MLIYEDDDICVIHDSRAGDSVDVTFFNWTLKPKRWPLWQREIAAADRAGIFVVAKWNHWYQLGSTEKALAAVLQVSAQYRSVRVMGSSMGGYAAIAFGSSLNARCILAVSPQYSIQPGTADFDGRWEKEKEAIPVWRPSIGAEQCETKPFVLFDSRHLVDNEHAQLLKSKGCRLVDFPFSGHPTGTALNDIGLFSRIFETSPDWSGQLAVLEFMQADYEQSRHKSARAVRAEARTLNGAQRLQFLRKIDRLALLGSEDAKSRLKPYFDVVDATPLTP